MVLQSVIRLVSRHQFAVAGLPMNVCVVPWSNLREDLLLGEFQHGRVHFAVMHRAAVSASVRIGGPGEHKVAGMRKGARASGRCGTLARSCENVLSVPPVATSEIAG